MKPTTKLILLAATLLLGRILPTEAQVKITDGAVLTLDANSLLELESTNKGLLISRVAINNLSLPAPLTAPVPTGMLVYSSGGTVADGFYYWDGAQWKRFIQAIVQVNEGGTGSSTQNFVDLTNAQTIGGAKTFTGAISASNLSGTNSGDQTISLTGDVTGSGTGSFATAIANNAVTYGKIQAVSATSRLLGSSASTTPVQEITLGAGLSMTGTTLSASASTFANPTATIGLTAINGSATTAMRSDAAPALSQAIVPTWTGAHTWSALGTFNLGLTASGAQVNINSNSNFITNINTGTSTGNVNIGSTSGTASLTQRVGTGGFSLDGVGNSNYTIASSTTTGTVAIGGTAQTGDIAVGSSTAVQKINIGTGTGDAVITLGNPGTNSGAGVRVGSARMTINKPTSPVVTGDANVTATVTQIFEAGIFICGPTTPGGRTFTFPTAQGAAGMVQGLPGTPAVGDVFFVLIINSGSRVLNLAGGTGCTIPGNTSIASGESRYIAVRVTSVASGSETVSIYL